MMKMSEKMTKVQIDELDRLSEGLMTDEQKDLTAVRERCVSATPAVKDWSDFGGYFDLVSPTTGFVRSHFEGRYLGEKVPRVSRFSFGNQSGVNHPHRYQGEGLTPDEAEAVFTKHEPVARALSALGLEEKRISRHHEVIRGETDRLAALALKNAAEKLRQDEITLNTEVILGQLDANPILDEASVEDATLIRSVMRRFVETREDPIYNGKGRARVIGKGNEVGSHDRYEGLKLLLLKVLRVDSEEKPAVFTDVVYGYRHSDVYKTALGGVIIRESFHRGEIGLGNTACIFIEDNPDPNTPYWAPRG